jgi:hypothetical protein
LWLLLQSDSLAALQPLLPEQKLWQQSWNWGSSNALHRHQHHAQQQQQQPSPGLTSGAAPALAAAGTAATAAPATVCEAPSRPRQQQQQSRLVRLVQGNSLKLQLKQQLEGLDLTADLAINEMCVDGVTRYATTPLRLAVDIAPSSSSTKRLKLQQDSTGSSTGSTDAATGSGRGSSWLQGVLFRVGLHGVVAPCGEAAAAAAGSSTNRAAAGSSSNNQQQQQQHREHGVCLHAQGALALTGSTTLWQAGDKPWEAAAAERRKHHKQQQQQQRQQQQREQAELVMQPLQLDNSSSSAQPGVTLAAEKEGSSSSSKASSRSSTGKEQKSSNSRSRHGSSSSKGGSGKQRVLMFQGQEYKLPLLNPGTVQESIQVCVVVATRWSRSLAHLIQCTNLTVCHFPDDAPACVLGRVVKDVFSTMQMLQLTSLTVCCVLYVGLTMWCVLCCAAQDASSSLERLRTDLRSWTTRVEAGELQNFGKKEPASGKPKTQRL